MRSFAEKSYQDKLVARVISHKANHENVLYNIGSLLDNSLIFIVNVWICGNSREFDGAYIK